MKKYYKFYSADNTYIEDVFNNSHLYMTDYQGMWNTNDDSEGKYWLDASILESLREKVLQEKRNLMICCVTNKMRNANMWHEFANDGNGICITIHPNTTDRLTSFKVVYQDMRPYIAPWQFNNISAEKIAEKILKHKLSTFSNEFETRILKRVSDGRRFDFLPVTIDRLYLGWNLAEDKEREFREYAAHANIKVIKLHKPIL